MASHQHHQRIQLTVIFRRTEFRLPADIHSTLGHLGQELQRLTGVAPHTMRLLTPPNRRSFSSSLLPFSDEHAAVTLQTSGLTEDVVLRMMGSLPEELKEIDGVKEDRSIIGFSEEDRRAKQRSAQSNTTSWKLDQGSYTFSQFRPLELPGIELDPAPDKALEIMHKLASDPGIVSIMKKHRWRVGLMTEMAPLGYVGITPKCVLGFNKNHGEEISLRLRTDDLKGFRKYESIKKTLLHELAHMVYSEHDANFFALDRQLNEESVALDWTKAKGRKWGMLKQYEENSSDLPSSVQSDSLNRGYKVGGSSETFRPNAQSAAAAAALRRLGNASTKLEEDGKMEIMGIFSGSNGKGNHSSSVAGFAASTRDQSENSNTKSHSNTSQCDSGNLAVAKDFDALMHENGTEQLSINRETKESGEYKKNKNVASTVEDFVALGHDTSLNCLLHPNKDMGSEFMKTDTPQTDALASSPESVEIQQSVHLMVNVNKESMKDKPDPDEAMDEAPRLDFPYVIQSNVHQVSASKDNNTSTITHEGGDFQWSGDLDSNVIHEPSEIACRRLQQAIIKLKEEASPSEASLALHTLSVILRNVIEYPQEAKFKRLKKENPVFQSRVAKFTGALDILRTVGFSEQLGGVDGDYLILERNDPGLLWLARSSLEMCMA